MENSLPIIIGSDTELYNAIHGGSQQNSETGATASQAVLDQIEGLPRKATNGYTSAMSYNQNGVSDYGNDGQYHSSSYNTNWSSNCNDYTGYNPQDRGRKYSPRNGGCNYIDLDHFETCIPEVRLAREFVAAFHANLKIAANAAQSATESLPDGHRVVLLANNVDPFGSSYGGHMNFHISKRLWHKLVDRSPFCLLFLLTFKISSIVYTGQGRVVISQNGTPLYRLTQRGLEMKCVRGAQTTFNRPIFNERDEPLCNNARLHDIFYDTNLQEPALYLKAGVNQLILAMLEEDYIDHNLIVDDPLASLYAIDGDPSLDKKIRLVGGELLTAVQLQIRFFELAKKFVDTGRASPYVGEVEQVLEYWGKTLNLLENRNFDRLARSLDWVLKKNIIDKAMGENSTSAWKASESVHMDMIYSSLNPSEGIYYRALADNYVERIITNDDIEYFCHYPPVDTRAWGRANLLRRIAPEDVVEVNWDEVKVRVHEQNYSTIHTVKLADVCRATKSELETLFFDNTNTNKLLEALETELESTAT